MDRKAFLRHIEALLDRILSDDDVENPLRRGLEAFLAALMEAEVSELAGAEHGERSPDRVTHRNGYRSRVLQTTMGTHELRIPKLRQGSYMPSFLKSRQRSDDALRIAVATCWHQGISTRNVEQVAQALGIDSLKKSTVSEMCRLLDPMIEAYRTRDLPRCPYVFLDARYENVREDHAVRKVAVLVALGVREDGGREVPGYAVERVENETYWRDFLDNLKDRGLSGVRLVVSDAHDGLRWAFEKGLPSARWQRCKVHFLRNLGARIPRKQRPALLALAKTIFAHETHEAALVSQPTFSSQRCSTSPDPRLGWPVRPCPSRRDGVVGPHGTPERPVSHAPAARPTLRAGMGAWDRVGTRTWAETAVRDLLDEGAESLSVALEASMPEPEDDDELEENEDDDDGFPPDEHFDATPELPDEDLDEPMPDESEDDAPAEHLVDDVELEPPAEEVA